jgi:hypothetical protein
MAARPVQNLQVLLVDQFARHKPPARRVHRFANCVGIIFPWLIIPYRVGAGTSSDFSVTFRYSSAATHRKKILLAD